MPKTKDIKKVLVIGSGPIVIGQAAEFDYAGTQACRALREEGVKVVLINSNPATIMTDTDTADAVYIEPLTVNFIEKIIAKEKPDGLLPTLGGQTGLNLAVEVANAGILKKHKVKLLGTQLQSIKDAEDRECFKTLMNSIKEPIPESTIINNIYEAQVFAAKIGFPLIIRPAYTLGGTGGGIAYNEKELVEITMRGLEMSLIKQVLLEQCVLGWKEIEYEVIRDKNDNCITICNMENLDAMGVHTGDSIVIAPSQTLSDKEYQMLRTASLKIIRALKIEGGCNVQFALDPKSFKYFVIEVNPRVSRSSALASKATGFPIARVSAKISIGLTLDEIKNKVTGKTFAAFEPALDYVVIKIPRWPFDKFATANRKVGTQMKATGEVMSIGRTFEETLLKAVRSLEIGLHSPYIKEMQMWSSQHMEYNLENPTDQRLFAVFEAFRRDMEVEEVHLLTDIDNWFLYKIKKLVQYEKKLREEITHLAQNNKSQTTNNQTVKNVKMLNPTNNTSTLSDKEILLNFLPQIKNLKRNGFSDKHLADIFNISEEKIRKFRLNKNILPTYKMVDTCAAEFAAETPYFYSTYEKENESQDINSKSKIQNSKSLKKAVVLGSGPIRIGQGIEFDYSCVHCAFELTKAGYQSIIINNNPETVSTDFDTADKLYFEPLTFEDVYHIIYLENPKGVVLQLGGQTPLNLAKKISAAKINILGTSQQSIDIAEDRRLMDNLLSKLNIPCPPGKAVHSVKAALKIANKIGFPVLVRPSYVLGGRAMEIVYNKEDLQNFATIAAKVNPEHPILIDKYFGGMEVEVDALSDGKNVLIPGIMEHIERAGVHSGDSMAVCPPQNISKESQKQIIDYTIKLAVALKAKGLVNIQYVIYKSSNRPLGLLEEVRNQNTEIRKNNKKSSIFNLQSSIFSEQVYVLEVNPRASRTVPYISKVTGLPLIKYATQIMLGKTFKELKLPTGLYKTPTLIGVKAPVFSFSKLLDVDVYLGPEMKSTGEIMGFDKDFSLALYKALLASGNLSFDEKNKAVLITVSDRDKNEAIAIAKTFKNLGFKIYATTGTSKFLKQKGINNITATKLGESENNLMQLVKEKKISLLINTPTLDDKISEKDATKIRRASVEFNIPCITSIDTAKALAFALSTQKKEKDIKIYQLGKN